MHPINEDNLLPSLSSARTSNRPSSSFRCRWPHQSSILLQGNEVEDEQVRKDGAWIPIKPLPFAFIANTGDISEDIPDIEHNVIVNSEKTRTSIRIFIMPNQGADLGPTPSLTSSEGSPSKFERTSFADYLKGYLSHELAGKSYLDTKNINLNITRFNHIQPLQAC